VDDPGDDLFSRAALTGDDNGSFGKGSEVERVVQYLADGFAFSHEVFLDALLQFAGDQRIVFREPVHLLLEPQKPGAALQGHIQFVLPEGLAQIVAGPKAHGLDHGVHIAMARDHDYFQSGPFSLDPFQHFDAVHFRQPDVQHHQVKGFSAQYGKCLGGSPHCVHAVFATA